MGFVFDLRKFWNVGRFVGFSPFFTSRYKTFFSQLNHPSSWVSDVSVFLNQNWTLSMFVLRDLCWSTQCSPLVGLCIWSALALDYFCKPSQELGGAWWTRASPHPNAGHGWPMLFFEFCLFTFFLPLEPSALMNAFIKLWRSGEAFPIDIGGTKTKRMMRFPIKSVFEPQNLPKTLCNWQLFPQFVASPFPFLQSQEMVLTSGFQKLAALLLTAVGLNIHSSLRSGFDVHTPMDLHAHPWWLWLS